MLARTIIVLTSTYLAAFGCLSAQIGPNLWWPIRSGFVMSWATPPTEPALPFVEQVPMGFSGGYAPITFKANDRTVHIVANATGVRYGNGSYVKGSKRRLDWHTDKSSMSSQHALIPDARDSHILYFGCVPEGGNPTFGGYQDYHIVKVDIKADTVTEPFAALLPNEELYVDRGLFSSGAVGAASYPALNRVWIVMLFREANNLGRWDDDSIELHAFRITNGVLYPPVITSIAGYNDGGKIIFNASGRSAYFQNTVVNFSPETGEFTVAKILKVPNRLESGVFSPSGRYLWVPRLAWDNGLQLYFQEILQYDLHQSQDSISPIYSQPIPDTRAFIGCGVGNAIPCAIGPDCRLYFSYRDYVGRIEYPDLEGDAAGFNPTWMAVPQTFRGELSDYWGLPDLVNQLTFPDGQKSCLWPRVEVPSDTICEGGCANLSATYYNNVDTWEWTFAGGVPSTFTGKTPPCVRYDAAGTYTVQLVVTNNAGVDTITSHVLVRARPNVSAGPDVQMCRGGSAVLTATGAITYTWQPREGLSDTSSASPTARPLRDTMMYVVTGTDAFGCTNVDTIVVRRGTLVAGITRDTSVCYGSSVTLQATGGDRFMWWPSAGLNTTSEATVVASPTTRTTYFVEVTSGTCIDTATVTVGVLPKPTIFLSGDTVVCAGDIAQLTATTNEPGAIVWRDEQGSVVGATLVVDVTPTQRKTYTAVFTSNRGCSDTQRITVDVERATSHADLDTLVCAGTELLIGGETYDIQRDTSWQVVATTPSGCADTSRITIRTESVDIVAEGASVCYGELATCRAYTSVRGGTDSVNIQWFDEFGTLLHTGTTYTTRAEANQRVIVRARSPLGCEATDTVDITIIAPQRWTTSIGRGSGVPGTIVHTTLTSSITQLPYRLSIAPTTPEALLTAVTPGRILNDGRDGSSIVIEVDASDADLTWRVYLGARQQIPLAGHVTLTDSTCVSVDVVPGVLDVEGCAILVRAIRMAEGARLQVYDLLGDLIADDTSTSAETTLANLRPGLYIVRMYTTTTRSDTLLLVE